MEFRQQKKNRSEAGGDRKSENYQKSVTVNLPQAENGRTSEKLASIAGVSEKTYRMGAKVLNSDNEDIKERVLSGETSISAGYKELTQKNSETAELNGELLYSMIFKIRLEDDYYK